MEDNKITPETILDNYSDLNKTNIIEAMKEFAGIKVIEALEIILKDLPANQTEKAMMNIDFVLEEIL
ncbi:MAG: hypothetical protein P0Y62_05510 [Candidatus Chryseobacterium colombiense]|nr:hypothetical protein [Chryseobacterium sp.]WEK71013.1 MAG: hypothetical protein P0Y62_05510 [Chryseobacterium sp.]